MFSDCFNLGEDFCEEWVSVVLNMEL